MLRGDELAAFDAFLIDLNRAAAAAILPLFRVENELQDKGEPGAYDPVTAADRGAEAAIRQRIAEHWPGHGVIGEEYGEDRPDAEFVWVIDPIDGTRAFIAGLPVWTTLIALRHQGKPVLGSIGQPYVGELFIGHAGGSRLIGREATRSLAVRRDRSLASAIIATTDPHTGFDRAEMTAWRGVRSAARLARYGCDAYAYAMVAAGLIDLVLEAGLKCWDIDAATPVIAGAGGAVTDWRGAPIGARGRQIGTHGGQAAISAGGDLLAEVLPLLAEAAK
jgi:histidinol phosphatase-like enzyme (inositol monophosphatase family)